MLRQESCTGLGYKYQTLAIVKRTINQSNTQVIYCNTLVLRAFWHHVLVPRKISEKRFSRTLKSDLYLKVSLVASYIELTSGVALGC